MGLELSGTDQASPCPREETHRLLISKLACLAESRRVPILSNFVVIQDFEAPWHTMCRGRLPLGTCPGILKLSSTMCARATSQEMFLWHSLRLWHRIMSSHALDTIVHVCGLICSGL